MVRVVSGHEYVRAIAENIAAKTVYVTADDILGASRMPLVCKARHELFAALWRDGLSAAEIGKLVGKDHVTVIYGIRKTVGSAEYSTEIAKRHPWMTKQRSA